MKTMTQRKEKNALLHVISAHDEEHPVALKRITPKGSIRLVFWGLRIYIVVMVVLVLIGFSRGIH